MNRTTMLTARGQLVDLALPALCGDALNIATIAHALAQINRFTGHARRPYSVAEHSLLVADIAERELRLDVHGQLAALMHDAHEAFVGDMGTPMKHALGDAFGYVEAPWQRAVQRAFALVTPSAANREAIKRADLMALAIERRDLMPIKAHSLCAVPWPALVDVPVLDYIHAPHETPFTWADWRDAFTDKFDELEFARNDLMEHRT